MRSGQAVDIVIVSLLMAMGQQRVRRESLVCVTRVVGEFVARVDERGREQSSRVSRKQHFFGVHRPFPLYHGYLRPQGHPLGPVHDIHIHHSYLRPTRLLITWICGDGRPPSWGWFLTVKYQNQKHGCAQDHP